MRKTEPGKREERAEPRGAARPEVLASAGSQPAPGQPHGGPGHVGTWPLLPGVRSRGSEEPPPLQRESLQPPRLRLLLPRCQRCRWVGDPTANPTAPRCSLAPRFPHRRSLRTPLPSQRGPPGTPALLPPLPRSPCRELGCLKPGGAVGAPRPLGSSPHIAKKTPRGGPGVADGLTGEQTHTGV